MHTDDDGNLVELKVGRDAHHEFCPGECHTGTIYRKWIGWRYDPDHVEPVREAPPLSDYRPGGPLHDPADDD